MAKLRVIREMAAYLANHKKLLLIPLLIVLALVGLVAVLAQSQSLAPFLYPLF